MRGSLADLLTVTSPFNSREIRKPSVTLRPQGLAIQFRREPGQPPPSDPFAADNALLRKTGFRVKLKSMETATRIAHTL